MLISIFFSESSGTECLELALLFKIGKWEYWRHLTLRLLSPPWDIRAVPRMKNCLALNDKIQSLRTNAHLWIWGLWGSQMWGVLFKLRTLPRLRMEIISKSVSCFTLASYLLNGSAPPRISQMPSQREIFVRVGSNIFFHSRSETISSCSAFVLNKIKYNFGRTIKLQ